MHNPGRLSAPRNSRGARQTLHFALSFRERLPRDFQSLAMTIRASATTKIITAKLNYSSLFYYE